MLQPLPSKRGSLELPVASHDASLLSVYDWLKDTVESVEFGKIGIEFTIHQSSVTRVQKTIVVSELAK